MVKDGAFSNKVIYVSIFLKDLNLEGHLNHFIGLKVTSIFMNGGMLSSGGVASGRVCFYSLCSRLVCRKYLICIKKCTA